MISKFETLFGSKIGNSNWGVYLAGQDNIIQPLILSLTLQNSMTGIM